MRAGSRWLGPVLCAGLLLPSSGPAQEPGELPPLDAPSPVAPPSDVEAIEVTGERLDTTNVQDEAQAITAFDQTDLDRAGILSVDNLGQNVPSLHVGQQGNQAIITLRGIGTQNASITGEPGVQFHIDGVNYARPAAARVAFFDLESVRVHRGPYGTRGGKNASGGAIEVITRKPTDEWSVEADYQIGSYDQQRGRAAINIPLLPERAKARLAFIREDRIGYQTNLASPAKENRADDADLLGLRGHLSLTPGDSLEALLSYNYYRARGVGPGLKLVGLRHYVPCSVPIETLRNPAPSGKRRLNRIDYFVYPRGVAFSYPPGAIPQGQILNRPNGETWVPVWLAREGYTRLSDKVFCADINAPDKVRRAAHDDPDDPRKVYLDKIQEQDLKVWGYSSTLKWDVPELPLLGATELTAIGGYEGTFLRDPRDFDATDAPILVIEPTEDDSYQYTGELRLASAEGDWIEWLAGLFYQRERSDAFRIATLYNSEEGVRLDQYNINKSYGAYADVKLHLSDAWTLGLGARYSHDYKRTRLDRRNAAGFNTYGGSDQAVRFCLTPQETNELSAQLGVPVADVPTPVCKDDWGWWTGEAVLEWRPVDDHLLYLQFDTGYKAGGFIISDSGRFDPERNRATTLGSKSQFFDGRLQLNVEGFYYLYRDFQIVNIDGLTIRTEIAEKVRVRGVELEGLAEPIAGLRLDGKIGWLDARFREFCSVDPLNPSRSVFFADGKIPCTGSDLGIRGVIDPADYGTHPDDILDGLDLPRSPRLMYTVGAEYAIPIGAWGTLTPRVQFFWSDEAFYRVYNTPVDHQDRYHKTDLRLIWTSPEETWTAEAFVENLENDDVFQNMVVGSAAVGSPPLAQYAPPRIYGFRVGFKY